MNIGASCLPRLFTAVTLNSSISYYYHNTQLHQCQQLTKTIHHQYIDQLSLSTNQLHIVNERKCKAKRFIRRGFPLSAIGGGRAVHFFVQPPTRPVFSYKLSKP